MKEVISRKAVRIEWEKPVPFIALIEDQYLASRWDQPGTYMWLHPSARGAYRCVRYVGRALGSPTVLWRLREHYLLFLGGRYCVPKDYRCDGQDYVPNQYPENVPLMKDVTAYAALLADARRYADEFLVTAAVSLGSDRQLLCDIERQLIYDVQPPDNGRGKLTNPNTGRVISHKNAPWESAFPD